MNPRYFSMLSAVSAVAAFGAVLMPAAVRAGSAPADDVQVLTRGPVHEAFAGPVSFDPRPGLVVRAEPPGLIEEVPPELQPAGDNVKWIPGYWAWDDERTDFIWISGIWRNLPPGRQWIPGYWSGIGDGQYQWTSGYWADSTTSEVTYLPAPPPRNIDVGPNIAAPSDDQSWIPGNWVWTDSRYLWRPGYWLPLRPDWTWEPSRYCWTRRGYVYVDGYWDYAVANRGLLFAPVCFNSPLYASPDYYYTPSIWIGLSVFADHLFVRPSCGQYYFGDYYGSGYLDHGYYASYAWHTRCRGYDPIYAYDRWCHRGDAGWEHRRRDDFDFFRNHEDLRPRHTWAAMQESGKNRYNDGRNRSFAKPLGGTTADGQHFRTLDKTRRDQFAAQGREMRQLGQDRHQMETAGRAASDGSSKMPGREKLARSPIIDHQSERLASGTAVPRRPESRGPNIRVTPATRETPQPGINRSDAARNLAARQNPATGRIEKSPAAAGTPRSLPERKVPPVSASRSGSESNASRLTPGREAGVVRDRPQQLTTRQAPASRTESTRQLPSQTLPQRQTQVQPQVRQAPQRQIQAMPQRQTQVQPQVRQAPQRQIQAMPQRQTQVQPQVRQAPQRQIQAAPQRQIQAAPQRQIQAAPQRQIQAIPQRQIQAAPQRQIQAAPQIRQAPQAQFNAAPQRQVQPGSMSPALDGRGKIGGRSR